MKVLKLIILFFLITNSIQAQLQSQVIDKVIAKVGGEYILLSELEQQYAYLKQSQPEIDESYRCEVIENLIAQKMMVNQAKLDSVVVGDDEVEANLDFRIESILQQMGNNEEFFEEYYGQSVNEVKEDMRQEQRDQLLSERMQSQIINEVHITPEEVKQFFESIPKDSLPLLNAEVELGEIVIKPEASQESKDKAFQKLLEIRSQIVNDSMDFAELASKNSDDFSSGSRGGELGWQKRGTFVPEFEAVAYTLENGELSDIVESEFGYHLIQLNERRGNLINTRHILIKPEVNESDRKRTRDFLDSLRLLVQSNSLDFSEAVKLYSDKSMESFTNNGRMTNPATRTTFYTTSELPPDIYFGIEDLEVGDVSAPLEFKDRGGEIMYRVVQLQSKSRPHIANLKEDYSKLRTFAIESKKNEYFNNWILSKLTNTYIRVSSEFETCPNVSDWIKSKKSKA